LEKVEAREANQMTTKQKTYNQYVYEASLFSGIALITRSPKERGISDGVNTLNFKTFESARAWLVDLLEERGYPEAAKKLKAIQGDDIDWDGGEDVEITL
jgi:hypothetical protein